VGELRFDGRVALVTGGGRGMGREHALLLARRGAAVVVSDAGVDLFGSGLDEAPANTVRDEIKAEGGDAIAYTGDLTSEDAARGAVRAAIDEFGRIDILVHNAGFTLGGRAFGDDTLDRLDKQLAINPRAAFALVNEAWPHFAGQRHGRVVLTASTAVYGIPTSVPYSTAKAAYIGLTRALAAAGAPLGITVNALAPAGATRMAENLDESEFRTWFLATMRPELVAPLVAVLSHDDCTATGELFTVGGGRVARTVLAETSGYVNPAITPEDLLAHFDEIMAEPLVFQPRDTADASAINANVLGHQFATPVAVVAGSNPDDPPVNRS
jgi:NAD(P)-dependent dehydrogenase (short-subunit alcohol dehydrogenase family)